MTENSSEQPKLSKAKGCLRIIGITVYSIIYIPLIILLIGFLMGERLGGDDIFESLPAIFWPLVAINSVLLFLWGKIRTKIGKWPLIIGYCIIFIGYPSYYALSYDPYGDKAALAQELSDEWWNYSKNKLENKLTQIMSQKDSNGEYVFPNYPAYFWSEQTGYVTCSGKLVYNQNGRGSASLSCPVGDPANTSGSWKIQWAPATNISPYDSDIIFSINNESMKFSNHIGSDNKLWTSVESFCKEHFSAIDAQKMMAYGDSLRNSFMNEKGLIIGSDGRFKKK